MNAEGNARRSVGRSIHDPLPGEGHGNDEAGLGRLPCRGERSVIEKSRRFRHSSWSLTVSTCVLQPQSPCLAYPPIRQAQSLRPVLLMTESRVSTLKPTERSQGLTLVHISHSIVQTFLKITVELNTMGSMSWPSAYPADCPPSASLPANGGYYRVVKNDPPDQGDFVPVYDLDQSRAEKEIREGRRSMCETLGLSIYADWHDAVRCAEQYPKLGDKIAYLSLSSTAGMVLRTGGGSESHNTWWTPAGFNPVYSVQTVTAL